MEWEEEKSQMRCENDERRRAQVQKQREKKRSIRLE